MATFYHDTSRRSVFDDIVRRSPFRNGPASCELELLEWSPGTKFRYSSRDQAEKSSSNQLTDIDLGDEPAEGRIIETNAQALRSRPRPRIQIV